MQSRKPIYRDLLAHVTKDELIKFMSQLKIVGFQEKFPVIFSTEVEQPVYYKKKYYHNALCCAVAINNSVMAQALLNAGANPNIADLNTANGSALSIAAKSKDPSASILFLMLLAAPNIERYAIDGLGRSVFLAANGNAAFVLMLLASDPLIFGLPEEEKKAMSNTIAEAAKSKSAYQTNTAICQMLKTVYLNEDEQKFVENQIEQAYSPMSSGQPIDGIVKSFLFQPKPRSLKIMENWLLNNEPQEEIQMVCGMS